MQIQLVEFVGLRTPLLAPAVFSWGIANERNVGLVRVRLSDGTEGWGETSVTFPLWSLEERAATVAGLAPLLTSKTVESPDDIPKLISELRRGTDRLRLLWSHAAISAALGGIEMALWDALGKSLDKPVWELLAGDSAETKRIPLYAVGFGGTPDETAQKAKELLDEGFAAVKIRVGFDPVDDVRLVEAVSNMIGGGLLADANMGWTRDAAADMTTRLNDYSLGWLEEPLSRDDPEGLRRLRGIAAMPLAGGENCYSDEELVALARSGTVDVVMPDLARVGGLTAAISGARAALELGLAYSTHHYASDVGFSAMLSLCAIVGQPAPILRDVSPWPIREDILTERVEIDAGTAVPYAGPGLSAVPRSDVMQEYRIL